MRFSEAGVEILGRRSCHPRLRICPLRGGYSTAAVVIAAAGAPDGKLVRFPRHGVAFVRRADTAGMGWRSGGRLREGNEYSRKRKQQQESGSQALHRLWRVWNPNVDPA
jgi:hypothetical protein